MNYGNIKNDKKISDVIKLHKEGFSHDAIAKGITLFLGDDGKPHTEISKQRVEAIISEWEKVSGLTKQDRQQRSVDAIKKRFKK